MKGVIEEFLEKIGMKKKPTYDAKAGIPFLHPGRQADVYYADKKIGYIGELHPDVADTYSIGERTYIVLLIFQQLQKWQASIRSYRNCKVPSCNKRYQYGNA